MSRNYDFEESLRLTKFSLKIAGINLDSIKQSNLLFHFRSTWLYFFWTLWMHSVVFGEICWTWCEGIKSKSRESLAVLIFMIPGIVLGFLGTVKTIFLLVHSSTLHQVIQELRSMFPGKFHYKDALIPSDDAQETIIVKYSMNLSRRVVLVLFWVNTSMLMISNLKPIYVLILKFIIYGEVEFTLPVTMKYPFNPYVASIWPILYLHQIWACIVAIMNLLGADTLFFVCCTHIYMHFRLLRHRMEVFIIEDETTDAQVEMKLITLVRRHQRLIKLVEMLETIFTKSNFFNCLTSSFLICLTGFNATTLNDGWSVLLYMVFLCSNVSQIFLICLFGDMIMNSSAEVADGLYHSKWYAISAKARKSIVFILARSQKPCKLTAAKYADINLKTFTTILSRSWSYFAVLNTMLLGQHDSKIDSQNE